MSESSMPQLNPEYFASQIFWLIFSFAILYIVMAKFALPKIANVIETREDIIARDLEDAENFKKDSEATELKYTNAIKEAQNKASESLANSREKLNKQIEADKNSFEQDSSDLASKFIVDLDKKKQKVLQDSEQIANEVALDIIDKILGSNALNQNNVKSAIKTILKN